MQLPPASVLATYPAPNYVNPVEHPPFTTISNLILLPLCIVVVSMRLYSRMKISKSFGFDDWLIILALLPTFPFCIISVLAELHYGWDRHVWDVPAENIQLGLRMILACECLFAASCTWTKLSMLVFILRVLSNTDSRTRKLALAAIVVIAAQGTAFCFIVVFQCNPISDYWKLTPDPQPNCLNQPANLLAAGIINTVTDLIVVLIPIPVVLGLQLPTRQQVIIVVIFSTGLLTCVAGSFRTYTMWLVSKTDDQTWAGYKVWLTGAIEMYLAILCASLPALKPLCAQYFPRFLGSLPAFTRSLNRTSEVPASASKTGTHVDPLEFEELGLACPTYGAAWIKRWSRENNTRKLTDDSEAVCESSRTAESIQFPDPDDEKEDGNEPDCQTKRTKSTTSERSHLRLIGLAG